MDAAPLSDLLADLRSGLAVLYGERLSHVILYGSQARGDARDGSDVDVAVVLRGEVNPYREIDRMSHLAFDLEMTYGPHVSTYPLSLEAFVTKSKPIVSSLFEEGVAL